jgi:hypothetical protein
MSMDHFSSPGSDITFTRQRVSLSEREEYFHESNILYCLCIHSAEGNTVNQIFIAVISQYNKS